MTLASCAFAAYAWNYFERGFAVLPTAGDDGKRPLIKGFQTSTIGPEAIAKLAERHPEANLGVALSPSRIDGGDRLVAVDVDTTERSTHQRILRRFGDSPIQVRTGSGNRQFWYRSKTLLPSRDLRSEGEPVEIKADGTIIVVPPSVNPKTEVAYEFLKGGLDDLIRLPEIDLDSLVRETIDIETLHAQNVKITEGHRNETLFRQALHEARHVDSIEELLDCCLTYNDAFFFEPLSEAEVIKTAASAWTYELGGNNWVGKEARTILTGSFLDEFAQRIPASRQGDALLLLIKLKLAHAARQNRGEPFCLVHMAMAKAQTIPQWSGKRYRTATEALLEGGYLECVSKGRGRRPNQYCLTLKALQVGLGPSTRQPSRWAA